MKTQTVLKSAAALALGVIAVTHSRAVTISTLAGSGHLFAWGRNTSGQLGDGNLSSTVTPMSVATPPQQTQLSAGAAHSLAVFADGSMQAWGDNSHGQLGQPGVAASSFPMPVSFPAEVQIRTAAAGARHSLALAYYSSQSPPVLLYAWGDNSAGQLGVDGMTAASSPVGVVLPEEVTSVAAGGSHSLALTPLGTVYAWGDNSLGQLGDGSTVSRSNPQKVSLPLAPGITVNAIAAGGGFSLALTSLGTVYAWGDNSFGQLGSGAIGGISTTPVLVALPQAVTGAFHVSAISAGANHSLAATAGAGLMAWGDNTYGQLGDGTTILRATPVTVELPPGTVLTAIAAGATHSIAASQVQPLTSGPLFAWGDNGSGQLGDGTLIPRLIPEAAPPLSSGFVADVAAGNGFTLALVHPLATSFTVVASPNPAPAGAAVQIVATLQSSDPASPPTGFVDFLFAGMPICNSVPLAGAAGCTMIPNGPGTITAQFVGTGSSIAVTLSASTNLAMVVPPPITVSVSPANPAYYGQPLTFSALVAGTPPPTGTVSFLVDGSQVGGANVLGSLLNGIPITNAASAGSPAIAALAPGTHIVTAAYSGDTFYPPGSQTFAQTVVQAGVAANLSSSVDPSDVGQPLTFTVTLSGIAPPSTSCSSGPACPPPPGGTGAGPGPPSPCSGSACAPSPGARANAVKSRDANCPATDPTCGTTPCVGTACPGPPPFTNGPPAPPTGAVTFTVDGNPISPPVALVNGQATSPPLTGLTPGSHVVWITYPGDPDYLAFPLVGEFGLPVSQTVRVPTSIILTNASPYSFGQTVTMSAIVPQTIVASPLSGTVIPSGTISFQEGSRVFAVQTLSGAQATVTIAPLSVGSHTVTTTYSGDNLFSGSTAVNVVVVNRAASVISWSNPAAITYGTALGATQLNATANLAGKFVYTPPAGTILQPGTSGLSVTFTPADAADYTTAAGSVSIEVNVTGNLAVASGQTYNFIGGKVSGNVVMTGGTLVLNNSTIGGNLQMSGGSLLITNNSTVQGNLQVSGGSTFSIGPGHIFGDLLIQNIPAGTAKNQICGATVNGNVTFQNNATAVLIGSPSCPGNTVSGNLLVTGNSAAAQVDNNKISGNLQILNNTASTAVFSNAVKANLNCSGNNSALITGGGNTAVKKQGQCAGF